MGKKGTGIKKHNWQLQNRQGDIKNSIGNGEAKEPTCTTHGHELGEGLLEGMRVPGRGRQCGKNWDNYNSIINTFKKPNSSNL